LAGNILWTYVFPGLPAFALLIAARIVPPSDSAPSSADRRPFKGFWVPAGALVPVTFALLIGLWHFVPYKSSQKSLVDTFRKLRSGRSHLVYLFDRPFSAEFCSASTALQASSIGDFSAFFKDSVQDFLAVSKAHLAQIPPVCASSLSTIGSFDNFVLFREKSAVSQASSPVDLPWSPGLRVNIS
jgi:hypothetical protein